MVLLGAKVCVVVMSLPTLLHTLFSSLTGRKEEKMHLMNMVIPANLSIPQHMHFPDYE